MPYMISQNNKIHHDFLAAKLVLLRVKLIA